MEDTDNKIPEKKHRRHLIRSGWIRIPLNILLWLMLIILCIPVLIYMPPVQTFVKDVACRIIEKNVGMKVEIGLFRLRFPLDVALDDVVVVEAGGDTMVTAKRLIADVKLRPLLDKDIRLNALRLVDGYYRMVAEDSSMILKLNAGLLDVDGHTSFALSTMNLDLNKARLRDGDIKLYMNVWKKKPTPPDSVTPPSPFLIKAADLKLENMQFAMSMLPTIDTLTLRTENLRLKDAVIDLGRSKIHAGFLGAESGSFSYLTPTAQYIKTHPAPIDTISPPSPPMTISADSVALDKFDVFYGTKGAKPMPGFDASYIQLADVNVSVTDFFNQSSTLRLPIARLMGKERCGLQILSGTGLFTIDSIGMNLQDIDIKTPDSRLTASAALPFALMELKPNAPVSAKIQGIVGFADIRRFMPSLNKQLASLTPADRLSLDVDAVGTLSSLRLQRLDIDMPRVLSLRARGNVENPLKFDRMRGDVDFKASLISPQVARRLTGIKDVNIPSFDIDGNVGINGNSYRADFVMKSSAGDITADGFVALTPETYQANVDVRNLDVGHIMPSLGVGVVTANLSAEGAGFNPVRPGAATDVRLNVARADYGGHSYTGIKGTVGLHKGIFDIDLDSSDPDATFSINGNGSIRGSEYTADIHAIVSHLDLQALHLSETENNGSFDIYVNGTANPEHWLYDMDVTANNLTWNMPDQEITLPAGVTASLLATSDNISATVDTDGVSLDFGAETSLQSLLNKMTAAATAVTKQIDDKFFDISALQKYLPNFELRLDADGCGVLAQLLHPHGFSVDSISANLTNADSLLNGNIVMLRAANESMQVDTLTANLHQRGALLDYALHMGNRTGNMPDFASVDVTGYIAGNRVSAYLRQHNDAGETGYRLGLTAAMMDSTITLHFTPLKATIAYMPWTFNADNHIDYNINNRMVDANLMASSLESSILVKTQPNEDGDNSLHLNLTNIHVQDFMKLAVGAPPLQATVNADMTLLYKGKAFTGNGHMDISQFEYDNSKIDDFSLAFNANLDLEGNTDAEASLIVAEKKVLSLIGKIRNDDSSDPNDFMVKLTEFPLSLANPFLGKDMAQLEGVLNGDLRMDGQLTAPILNGELAFDKAAIQIPMMASKLRLNSSPITMVNNVVEFNDFGLTGQNENPLLINGKVDLTHFDDIIIDLSAAANNFLLVDNDKRSRADLYGKLFLNLGAQVTGPMSRLDINGNLTVLNSTDVTYAIGTATQSLDQVTQSDVVKFVNFSDSTAVAEADSAATSSLYMRIRAALTINPGAVVTIGLPPLGSTNKVQLTPSGTLNYYQNYMGDMRLSGQLLLGEGIARYSLPVVGEKLFTLENGSYVQWNGPILNPILNIKAYDEMKVNISEQGNSRLVNFLVNLDISNSLEAPKVVFDLSAEGDMTIQNELQSMTPDQRSNQAMNLLLYGQYTGPNTKTIGGNIAMGAVYSFLTSRLNNWAANNIRGVDLSFGIDQYDKTQDGSNTQTTSYSYQMSKSLFNNKFKIVVGGNYSTDASDEDFAQNLISDVSFEYMLKQTNSLSMLVRLFRHNDFESILEGEVTEMGVGFVMKRRMENLRRFFRVRWGKRKQPAATTTDSVAKDTITKNK